MSTLFRAALRTLLPTLALLALGSEAAANTLTQNVSWTINRADTATKYRLVAYGDSIYAGYNGSISNAAKYAAPTVDAEYLSALWSTDIESVRRAKSGAVASDIYNNKIVAERSYMQASSTRVVTFEMCGNDGLQARSSFKSQTGTCNYAGMNTAVNNCKTYVAAAMDYINANAYAGTKVKIISNLHYPGYAADNVQSSCTDAGTGATVNLQSTFLPKLATMNYWMCEYARQKGFKCADNFAQYMGADYDRNGDGQVDSDALRYVAGESESSYVTRITVDAAVDATRRQHALRVLEQQLRLHPVRQHPPDLHRRHRQRRPVRRHHRLGRATLHLVHRAARTRSGTSTGTSAWAGRCRPPTRRRPEARQAIPWTGRVVLARRRPIRSPEVGRGARLWATSPSRWRSSQAASPMDCCRPGRRCRSPTTPQPRQRWRSRRAVRRPPRR